MNFYDAHFARLLQASPEVAAELGLRRIGGQRIAQDRWTDVSPAGDAARRQLMAEALAALRARPVDPDDDPYNRPLFEFFLEYAHFGRLFGTASAEFALLDQPADHMCGVQTEMFTCLGQWQPLLDDADEAALFSRVQTIAPMLDGLIEGIRARAAAGNRLPDCLRTRVLGELDQVLATRPQDLAFVRRYAAWRPEGQTQALADAAQAAMPTLASLRDTIAGLPAEPAIGLCRLEGGRDYFAFRLRAFTTTRLGANEIHALGREQLATLQAELDSLLRQAGHAGADWLTRLRSFLEAPCHRFAADETHATLPQLVETIIDEMQARVRPLFHLWPRTGFAVTPIPATQEDNRLSAYAPGATDGSRPGSFDLNRAQILAGSRLDLYTLCYHEVMPGHHVQLSLAQELGQSLPDFRRALVHDAYIEGWAKYAETLPEREGLTDNPDWTIARRRNELYSTANLVLETGIHAQGWSRDQGIDFVLDNTGASRAMAEFLADRSIARPGQMCAYRIGMQRVLDAHRRMREARGAAFDIRRFHDLVLGQGSLPLDLLDALIDRDIVAPA